MKKKIVFVHLYNDRSGSPKVLLDVVNVVRENGIDYDVITSSHKNGFLSGLPEKTRHVYYERSENKLLTLLLYLVSQLHLFYLCLSYRKQKVIFYINTMMPFSAALAGKLLGKEVIYHVHETSIRPLILKRFLRWVIEVCASRVIFVSRYLAEVERFNKPASVVVHNAIPTPASVVINKAAKQEGDVAEFNVLMACSLKPYKGVFEFIKLAASLADEEHITFTLVLNASRNEVSNFIDIQDLPGNLQIVSRQTDLAPFYDKASVVLNLSLPDMWVETFGLTLLEAMSYGLPVIAPNVGGPAEIVTNGVEGYLISPYELEHIKEALLLLRGDTALYELMSQNAIARARDFSHENFKQDILNVLAC